jgi:hypothetical protein
MHYGVFAQASAGSAVLALVGHAIMAVSLEEGGSRAMASDSRGFAAGAVSGVDRVCCLGHRDILLRREARETR